MREKLVKFQEETGNIYNLEATPAEGCSYRLAKRTRIFIRKSFVPMTKNTKKGTNPLHKLNASSGELFEDIFEVLEHQDNVQTKYTGGTVLHGFVGERIHNIEGLKQLVKIVCQKFKLPYFTITRPLAFVPTVATGLASINCVTNARVNVKFILVL